MKVGICGFGFVGSTYANGLFKLGHEVRVYDPFKIAPKEYGKNYFEEVSACPIIFLALPTIPKADGSEMDVSIIVETLEKLRGTDSIVIIKSTVLPGATKKWCESFEIKNLIFMPEFLSERTAMFDFMTQDRIIIGTVGRVDCRGLFQLFKDIKCPKIVTDSTTAEFLKFSSNILFATKVAFANQMKDIADLKNVDWNEVKEILYMDSRIGQDHLTVYENKRGFGGHCLPKDLYQFTVDIENCEKAKVYKTDVGFLRAIINRNRVDRHKKKDWAE